MSTQGGLVSDGEFADSISMSTLAVVYAGTDSAYTFEPFFGGHSAFECCLNWINSLSSVSYLLVLTDSCSEIAPNSGKYSTQISCYCAGISDEKKCSQIVLKQSSTAELLQTVSKFLIEHDCDQVLFAFGYCPFYDKALTEELLDTHIKYGAEYTFADCYPAGLAPEILASETVHILTRLVEGGDGLPLASIEAGKRKISFDSIFSVIKTDINAFEIETVLSPVDMRLYRLEFSCRNKRNMLSCRALYEEAVKTDDFSSQGLCRIALSSSAVLRTIPSFYYIQIAVPCTGTCVFCPYPAVCKQKYGTEPALINNNEAFMPLVRFEQLIEQAWKLSEEAVVSLSLWGEALLHPEIEKCIRVVLERRGLSLCIETDACVVTESLLNRIIAAINDLDWRGRLFWIVSCDAASAETYAKLHGTTAENFAALRKHIDMLQNAFPQAVYEQFVRMNENEHELELFYRYWKENGHELIQKYDNFCGVMPDRKTADLTPVERKPCWHLRRDMHILVDGTVPICRERLLEGSLGCVFDENVETIWQRGTIDERVDPICGACDEYYTFNF